MDVALRLLAVICVSWNLGYMISQHKNRLCNTHNLIIQGVANVILIVLPFFMK
jgi:hypothetical protein